LIIYSRYKDKKDLEKLDATALSENHPSDEFFIKFLFLLVKEKMLKQNLKFTLRVRVRVIRIQLKFEH
jgi:hypothetical protein